jgi:hypothetical protein
MVRVLAASLLAAAGLMVLLILKISWAQPRRHGTSRG